jgi:predicted DNA-binding transcriptional regulator AlpA
MAATSNPLQQLLTERDVARITGLSVASVRRWRLLRQGPKYLKIGAAVRYKPGDISAWLESRPSGGGHQAEGTTMNDNFEPQKVNRERLMPGGMRQQRL